MTVEQMGAPVRWKGLSTDTKPSNQAANSTFLETDTNDLYECDGFGDWFQTHENGATLTSERGRISGENNNDTSNEYLAVNGKWNRTVFNPRAASIGSALGAAGSVGTTELQITATPCLIGRIVFESDNTGNLLLRNVSAPAQSAVAESISSNTEYHGGIFSSGLTVCGSATTVRCVVYWKSV